MAAHRRRPLQSLRILIAMPDDRLRRWLAAALRGRGARVTAVRDTYGALKSALSAAPDVAILSDDIPPLQGQRLPRILRELAPRTKIIRVSRGGGARRG